MVETAAAIGWSDGEGGAALPGGRGGDRYGAAPCSSESIGTDGARAAPVVPRHSAPGGLFAGSAAMRSVDAAITRLATSVIPVLIQGETGVGKEVVARQIHTRGPRNARPLICVNCGAIPGQLVESSFFGHERGAFSGAAQRTAGAFEAARGGTLLLDEIGELPLPAQAALLRVLETGRIARVGSPREIVVDVRVLASTHRDLGEMCQEGTFRRDLLYRINAMTLDVPPLRARPEEIEGLGKAFLRHAAQVNRRPIAKIAPAAQKLLEQYDWPGNVRELRNAIERAVVVAESDAITVRDLPPAIHHHPRSVADQQLQLSAPEPSSAMAVRAAYDPDDGGIDPDARFDFRARLRRFECQLLLEALQATNWNRVRAARLLGLPLRTLARRMSHCNIRLVSRSAAAQLATAR